jgi:SAM-dependent methyltransferase
MCSDRRSRAAHRPAKSRRSNDDRSQHGIRRRRPGQLRPVPRPILFHHYADDLVARLTVTPGMRVLETACGTGIVTRRLVDRLGARGSLVATDLNQAMVDQGRARLSNDATVEWQAADATRLPFPDRSFDAVVCQFGVMFFPDKAAGLQEALRVLKPGGTYLFNVWDAIEHNEVCRITHETVAGFFPDNPPQFTSSRPTAPQARHRRGWGDEPMLEVRIGVDRFRGARGAGWPPARHVSVARATWASA